MANTIDVARVLMFSENYKHIAQEMGGVYRGLFEDVEVVGKRRKENFIGTGSASTKTGRLQGITYADPAHTARWLTTSTKYEAIAVDKEDILRVLTDPRSKYMEHMAMTMNREFDTVIEAAFDAAVTTGEDADGSAAFDTTNNQVAAGSANLTIDKLRETLRRLEVYGFVHENPNETLYFSYNPSNKEALLGTTQIGSIDYNNVKALVQGEIDTFMGFKFLTTTLNGSGDGLGIGASVSRDCWAFSSSAMQVGHGRDIHVKVSELVDLVGHPWQLYVEEDYGAMRMYEGKIVQVIVDETA